MALLTWPVWSWSPWVPVCQVSKRHFFLTFTSTSPLSVLFLCNLLSSYFEWLQANLTWSQFGCILPFHFQNLTETHVCTSCTKLKSFNRIFIPSLQCSLQTLWSMLYKASLQTIVFLLSWTRVQYEKWQKEKKRRKDNESLIMLFPAKGKQNLRFICLNCESKTQKGAFTLTLQDLVITLWAIFPLCLCRLHGPARIRICMHGL